MFKDIIKGISNIHAPSSELCNIVIASAPRSGSTWLMELIWSQNDFKVCNEPLNVRVKSVADSLDINNFEALYNPKSTPKIFQYFTSIVKGGKGFLNPSPLRKHWRFRTNRIVYKIINGAEHQFDDISQITNSKLVFLVRHPFSVSLSRKFLPRLEVLCDFVLKHDFSQIQKELVSEISKESTFMEKAVLSWSIQNSIFLKYTKRDFTFITYEELVVNPDSALKELATILNLPSYELMIQMLNVPSAVTVQSDMGVKKAVQENKNAEELCTRWKKKLSSDQVDILWKIMEVFELDTIYDKESGFPNDKFTLSLK
jgi:hypothetical protein